MGTETLRREMQTIISVHDFELGWIVSQLLQEIDFSFGHLLVTVAYLLLSRGFHCKLLCKVAYLYEFFWHCNLFTKSSKMRLML